MTVTAGQAAPARTPQRPDECADVARHALPQRQGDHRKVRRYQCPSCGFWCLLAPAEEAPPVIRPVESDEPAVLICVDCDSEFLVGQSCECSAPPALDLDPGGARAMERHQAAMRRHPDCEECRVGKGYIVPGPAHSSVHRGHCSCSGCF